MNSDREHERREYVSNMDAGGCRVSADQMRTFGRYVACGLHRFEPGSR